MTETNLNEEREHLNYGNRQERSGPAKTWAVFTRTKHSDSMTKLGRLLRTAALCWGYFTIGMCISITGPTLPYLQLQVHASVGEISYIFTARSIGTIFGSFVGGILLARYNAYVMFFIVTMVMAIGTGCIPWCIHLWLLIIARSTTGISGGFYDTRASVLCLQLWRHKSGPYMQAMHFCYALGATVAPLLAEWILPPPDVQNLNTSTWMNSSTVLWTNHSWEDNPPMELSTSWNGPTVINSPSPMDSASELIDSSFVTGQRISVDLATVKDQIYNHLNNLTQVSLERKTGMQSENGTLPTVSFNELDENAAFRFLVLFQVIGSISGIIAVFFVSFVCSKTHQQWNFPSNCNRFVNPIR